MKKIKLKWYYGVLLGFAYVMDGLVLILSLGNLGTTLSLKIAVIGAKYNWVRTLKTQNNEDSNRI